MDAKIARPAPEAPDLNDVALFVDVVQASSFSAAALKRGLPVSTVSRRIARLEGRLGTRLLERTTRRLRLTDVGRAYCEHAERALAELTQGSDQVRALHAVPRGRVRITAPIGIGARLTGALAPYLLATPEVTIDIDLTDRHVDLLAEGHDIALRGSPVDSADFVARRITESTRRLFASAAYLERRGRPRRIAELTGHDLVAVRASPSGAEWELFSEPRAGGRARRQRLVFKPRLVVNELYAARSAAVAGIGIVLLPSPELDKGELVRVLPAVTGGSGGLWLHYSARRSLSAAVRSCVEHLLRALPAAF